MAINIEPIRLLHWTRWFNSIIFEGQDKLIEDECLVPEGYKVNMTSASSWCTITTNDTEVATADALLFHAADYGFDDVPKQSHQNFILYTLESPLTAPFRQDPLSMEKFDYLASYHQKSQYFFTYFGPAVMDVANRPLPTDFMRRKSNHSPILWIAKNCQASNGREYYISELMKYIDIDSYGECLNTKPFPKDKTREQLMTEYKFYLAIENANCDDYVTEKLADTLKFSAVPIVDGPNSYDGYLPTQRSAIRMDAYPDPRDLAKYIRYLDENDDAYLTYLAHRKDALVKPATERLDPLFVSLWSDQTAHDYRVSWCSICRHMATTWQQRHSGDEKDLKALERASPRKDRFLVDDTCMVGGKWNYAVAGPPYDTFTWTPTPKDEFPYQQELGQQQEQQQQQQQQQQTRNPSPSSTSLSSPSFSPSLSSSIETGNITLTQDRIGMLALVGVSIGAVGFVFWMIYKRSNKHRRYTRQDSSQL